MSDPAPRSRRAFTAVVATLLGLAIALLLAEGLTRVFFDEAVQPRFVIDAGYGVRANKPDVVTRHYVPGDYEVTITTNSAGMRGQREYPVARVPGKRRILMLGDSFPFGYGVEDEDVVSAVLETLLNAGNAPAAEGGGGYEVINLSVAGFGQAEELVTWEKRAREYRPDVVVLFYFDNDVGNNAVAGLYEVAPDGTLTRTGRSFLPGTNFQDYMLEFAPTRWLFEHSEAWNLIRHRLSSLVQQSLIRKQGFAGYDDTTPKAIALTRALLKQLATAATGAGAQVIFVLVPNSRTNMSCSFPLTTAEVQALGASLVDGREYLTQDDSYPHDLHWRPSGHRKTAERLATLIRAAP
jgi:hypothetical protein